MPNRIIKESICSSESIDSLSWFEEVFFYRLIVNCDDYGRFDARPQILKARLFPLRDVRTDQIKTALNKLSTVGMVYLYEFEGKPFLQLITWEQHQRVRSQVSKYPDPNNLRSNDSNLRSNAPVIQSNPNPNPNTNTNSADADSTVCHKYGQYKNVRLTEEQMEKLKAEFPRDFNDRIESLSEYMASTGKTYKNHLATIRAWAKKDSNNGKGAGAKKTAFNSYTQTGDYSDEEIERLIFGNGVTVRKEADK